MASLQSFTQAAGTHSGAGYFSRGLKSTRNSLFFFCTSLVDNGVNFVRLLRIRVDPAIVRVVFVVVFVFGLRTGRNGGRMAGSILGWFPPFFGWVGRKGGRVAGSILRWLFPFYWWLGRFSTPTFLAWSCAEGNPRSCTGFCCRLHSLGAFFLGAT